MTDPLQLLQEYAEKSKVNCKFIQENGFFIMLYNDKEEYRSKTIENVTAYIDRMVLRRYFNSRLIIKC